ncbi:16S rRNA (guanine(966)-N(2))-methyltransferase RsmD [Sphingomonas paeninsulae]|jgi:16S rRNA (guanine966-N2)-methyltransferase|uniref:16S rRNA (Guanine(966)-N(2))-methyltransferase RsmD n=1 Tax=Sphingomonas paeninsulae TaxID=2319844 RepID=A0A494TR39_SPHPE|nr:RsmD family RNA methyltransferase [Sphingomonas paeninsulae]AYJ87585.1 16S rRNA (guanine(966)-N(2))-methyltransferase RsmD [Sphingomonas paeninsulae]
MRIISGIYRGRPLIAPKGDTTRPTADRTREALFSMLVSRLGSFEGLRVLDLFAGSGALGLEALSRGAASCTFVEQDGDAISALKTNIVKMMGDDSRPNSFSRAPSRILPQVTLSTTASEESEAKPIPPTRPKTEIRAQSVMALGPAAVPYDLILLDPPYESGAGIVALERLLRLGWIAPGALASVETMKKETVTVEGYDVEVERVHGKAKITLLRAR